MAQSAQSQLGLYLREARESRGVSLAQAAAETRIIQRYLAALENGEYHHLPGDVYARGFIRNYAQYLNLPADELIEMYRAERGVSAPIKVVPAAVPPRTSTIFVPSFWAVVLVVMVLVVVGYLTLNFLGLTSNSTKVAAGTTTATVATPPPLPTLSPAPTNADGSTAAPLNPLGPTATTSPTIPPTPSAPVEVTVRVVEGQSWMQITVDGVPTNGGEIQNAGWSEIFRGQNTIVVKAGNGAVVEVSFNGGAFTRLTDRQGAVVTKTYTPVP
jgi:cytoskeletal protein RodZ